MYITHKCEPTEIGDNTMNTIEYGCEDCGSANSVGLNRFGKGYGVCEVCGHREIVYCEELELVEA